MKERILDSASLFFSLAFIVAGILVSLNRFWQYEVYYYDFGIFDSAIWQISRFKPPVIEHLAVGEKIIFADHFSPSIFLLSPLYWITERSEVLLIAQALAVGISGIFLYKIGKEILKNGFMSLSILISYYLFLGVQNAVISDFHEVTIMSLPLMILFWAIIKEKTKLFFISLLITLGFKESTFLLGIGIAIFIFLSKKQWRRIALSTMLISVIWGFLAIKIIIPFFSDGVYNYSPLFPQGVVNKATMLFDHPMKINTFFYTFLSFGFLPILSPSFFFLIFSDFVTRFVPDGYPTRWGLGLHYSIQIGVIMAVSSIYSLRFLGKIKSLKKIFPLIGLLLIFNALILFKFILHGPFGLSYNLDFYKHSKDFEFLDKMIKVVSKNATVMTQNNLATRFTHQKVWLLRKNYYYYNPDYILLDLRSGQNPNNFFGSKDYLKTFASIKKDKSYEIVFQTQDQFIFKRK